MMKRILFVTLCLIFSASLAFAQNANQSEVAQDGDANKAIVEQAGTNQVSAITQIGGNENKAVVDQFTTNNGPQTSVISQNGKRNDASVKMVQSGEGTNSGNEAIIDQIGNDNTASQVVNATDNSYGLSVSAIQKGDRNSADQEIDGGYATFLVVSQTGNENVANQYMTGTANISRISQDGNSNRALQENTDKSKNWNATIEQIGAGNVARQMLKGGDYSQSNVGSIYQDGTDNLATQDLTAGLSKLKPTVAASIHQVGNGNEASQSLTGNLHSASISQTGHRNLAKQEMTLVEGATALFTQIGNDNVARLLQNGGDTFTLMQDGDDNVLRGVGAQWASQTGSSTATVDQIGNGNVLNLHQEAGASAMVSSVGNGNIVTVNQH